jgi:hypothetical protein
VLILHSLAIRQRISFSHRRPRRDDVLEHEWQLEVFLQFDLNRNIDSAPVDVQTAIAEVMPRVTPTSSACTMNRSGACPIIQNG